MVERPEIREHLSVGNYTLTNGVFFISGAKRGAIYDLNTANIYSINQSACDVLTGVTKNPNFWKKLESIGLAVRKKEVRNDMLSELLKNPSPQFIWFEIVSEDCNESCIHCYAECMPPSYRKAIGLSEKKGENSNLQENDKRISFNKWNQLIDESHSLGCRRCQFIGGEPMLYRGENGETVFDLAEHAKAVGFEFIEIFTNATLLTSVKVQRIKALGLNVAVSLYSNDESIHDSITKTPGSFRKTMEALKFLQEANVPVRVETVLMRPNEETINETQKFVEGMGFSHKQPDVLRPKGRGDNLSIMPTKESVARYGLILSPSFSITKDDFSRNVSGHPCLSGKIAITDNGDVLPCIFSRGLTVGNVLKSTLREIISGRKLRAVWGSTKDDVLVCKDCEYRYACFDCRPLSEGINQGRGEYLSAPYPRCTYNPYTGEWAGGVWRVDEKKPYYDKAMKPAIERTVTSNEDRNILKGGDE